MKKIKQTIRQACEQSGILRHILYEPYAQFCEKRRQRHVAEEQYHLNDADYCLHGTERMPGINFWFLLEQGHNNIGDIAIGLAEYRFFETYFPDVPKHFIYEAVFDRYRHEIARQIKPGDVIVLRGGGSIGNTVQHEKHREEIISRFRKNLIVSMPQTMCFPDTPKGEKEKGRAAKVYSTNRILLLLAREKKSFQDMQAIFSDTRVMLLPDIVMTMTCWQPRQERSGVLLCFRSDWEKSIPDDRVQQIEKVCRGMTASVQYTDMYAEEQFVPIEKRAEVFQRKIDQFKHASLVITDRLHGMVFCAISGTPCIALPNYNHKVQQTYQWLRQLPYIRFCDTAETAIDCIPEMYHCEPGEYDNAFTTPYYKTIADYIRTYVSSDEV